MSGRARVSLVAIAATVALVALIVPLQAGASSVNPASQLNGYLTLGFTPGATDIASSGFRFYSSGATLGTPIATQGVSVSGCTVTTPTSGTANLAKVTTNTTGGIGGNLSNGSLIGLGARPKSGSGASGTPCGRVDFGEKLTISLLGTSLQGYSIDEADLDIEAKFGTKVNADLYLAGVLQNPGGTQITDTIADSGPNCSGCNNWSFAIKGFTFDTIVLTPLVSPDGNQNNVAFSLEGGIGNPCIGSTSDCIGSTDPRHSTGLRAQLGTRQSVFHVSIASTDDSLDCNDSSTAPSNDSGVTASVDRLDNVSPTPPCEPISISLTTGRDADNNPTVSFRKDLGTQTTAQFLLNVTWPEETPVNPPGTEHKTKITYDGSNYHDVLWCLPGSGAQVWTPPGVESYCLVSHNEQLQPDGKVVVDEQLYGLGDPGLKR
jgi:hypothetical protein